MFKDIYSGWGLGKQHCACLRPRVGSPAPREKSHLSECPKAFLLVFHSLRRHWESGWRGKWEWAGSWKGLSPHSPVSFTQSPVCEVRRWGQAWMAGEESGIDGGGVGGLQVFFSILLCRVYTCWKQSSKAKVLNMYEVKAIASSWAKPLLTCTLKQESVLSVHHVGPLDPNSAHLYPLKPCRQPLEMHSFFRGSL